LRDVPALHSSRRESGFRQQLQDAIAKLTNDRDLQTTVRMSGALSAVSDDLAEQATPVIIEAISKEGRDIQEGLIEYVSNFVRDSAVTKTAG
jgi:hypothetical protein